ncbi:type VI secretion system contractile sheath small subunit [Helicobacter saguini]|uniref:Type VI secretion system contractile sheath small subunit n=1 Tax=Helicobacter saguini TaxID=1548018 RepID=A0A347VQX5_9HELI|nr:type VI secretion system contractile sheath small subunit [Helicobacter saguini]MWV63120.1 type VI secretion system contractile sheath small subunit [Helicobacter saguini]MWV66210.1 type VI secretion system contractile sheath small subunit [Helicobacter saguini]MWV68560.1 type VI secretion system contractile sheath small subunit [Helicobacter saguini]MWV71886.1 type VI secretion system contractile sheath small subunit [Helicobacter saguini]TLD95901.1 type VI secretion system contractile she
MAESIAPKERINITYKTKTNGQNADVELPLKLMVMADLTGDNKKMPLENREVVSINKINFNQVMKQMGINVNFSVKNKLNGNENDELNVNLNIESMRDFSPDGIVEKIPELKKLMQLREALLALKGPMGNIPEFRKAVLEALQDDSKKEKLLLEISGKDNI